MTPPAVTNIDGLEAWCDLRDIKYKNSVYNVLYLHPSNFGEHEVQTFEALAEKCTSRSSGYERAEESLVFFKADGEKSLDLLSILEVSELPAFCVWDCGLKKSILLTGKILQLVEKVEYLQTLHLCKSLSSKSSMVIFIKGTPDAPRCGFTRQLITILEKLDTPYDFVNILEDDLIRQGMKEFSDWPTFPQIYMNGGFIGGLDIFMEMVNSGELSTISST